MDKPVYVIRYVKRTIKYPVEDGPCHSLASDLSCFAVVLLFHTEIKPLQLEIKNNQQNHNSPIISCYKYGTCACSKHIILH